MANRRGSTNSPAMEEKSLLSSPGRRDRLSRQPIKNIPGFGAATTGRRGSNSAPTALSSDEEDVQGNGNGNILDDISVVSPHVNAGNGVKANSPPSAGFKHSSPVVVMQDCMLVDGTDFATSKSRPVRPIRKSSSRTRVLKEKPKRTDSQGSTEDSEGYKSDEKIQHRKVTDTEVVCNEVRPKTKTDDGERKDTERSSTLGPIIIVSILVLLLGVAYYFHAQRVNQDISAETKPEVPMRQRIKEVLDDDLRVYFPNQLDDTWRIVKSRLNKVNTEDNDQAACIAVVSNAKAASMAKCFAAALANTAVKLKTKSQLILPISPAKFVREKLDEDMMAGGAVITDVNELDGETGLKLHPFCDSEYVPSSNPYVHSTLVTTIALNKEPGNAEADASDALSESWEKTVSRDKVSSLISRVVLSAIKFQEEEQSEKLKKYCSRFV